MATGVQIRGGRELAAKLRALPEKLREAAGRKAARKAMAIVRADARRRLERINDPNTPEDIGKNVFIQQSRSQSKRIGGVVMRVGILGGARTGFRKTDAAGAKKASAYPGGDTRYWRFIELGTEKMRARPFLRPALEQNAAAVVQTLTVELGKELDKIAREA